MVSKKSIKMIFRIVVALPTLKGELVAELLILGLLASGPLEPHDAVDDAVDMP